MRFSMFGACVAFGVAGWTSAWGQPPRLDSESPRDGLSRQFAKAPRVGDALPNVKAFDGDGRPFELGNLRGSYSVLVFGCLT